jgi:ribosomal protein L37AE/L43A
MGEREKFLPRLVFKREIDGKEETFVAIYNEEMGGTLLDGVVRYLVEIDELISFLSQIKDEITKRRKEKEVKEGICYCGSKDVVRLGRGVWLMAPLVGNEYEILRCNSCGREFKKITAHY